MDDGYTHGREHADLERQLRDACARLDSHLLEHEGLAVPHHSHSAGQDIEEALHDLASRAEEPVTEGAEAEAAEEPSEPVEAPSEPESAEEVHPSTVDDLLPPEDGEPEGEPKRAHPLFQRVFGE